MRFIKCVFLKLGSASNLVVLCYNAKEDSEFCPQCFSPTGHSECGTGRSCQFRCRAGSRICETRSKSCLSAGMSAENCATSKLKKSILRGCGGNEDMINYVFFVTPFIC